jgi:hypothetical protein
VERDETEAGVTPGGKWRGVTRKLEVSPSTMAEREGFEPPVPCGTTVFKTAAFDHSAISPNSI